MHVMCYGLRDGTLVSATEVQRGLACGCFCPACGGTLVAKKGSYRTAHFAHFDREDCGGWLETIVHQRAKALLIEEKKLMLPPVYRVPGTGECKSPWKLVTFEKIDLEVTLGNGRADAIGIINGRPLAIEIAVTHKISKKRIFEYRELGHAAVEIDFLPVADLHDDNIRSILTTTVQERRWICNQYMESCKLWQLGQQDYSLNSPKLRRRYYAY